MISVLTVNAAEINAAKTGDNTVAGLSSTIRPVLIDLLTARFL